MSDTTHEEELNQFEDHTANILPEDQRAEPSEAVQSGLDDAKANAKAEEKVNGPHDGLIGGEAIEEAQETARINAEADQANIKEGHTIAKNDTSKAGKVRTSKSQLDPTGEDRISTAEVTRAATDGTKVHGGTDLSNEEVAERAKNPGKAEEENPASIAGEGVDPKTLKATDDAKHANGNENETTGEGGIADQAGPSNAS